MALSNYADLQAAVLSWLARPGDPLVAPAVPDMVRLFEAEATRRLKAGGAEKIVTTETVPGMPSIQLPPDFGELRRAAIDGRTLALVAPSSLPGLSGQPLAYSIWGHSQLWLGPAPDRIYTIELLYQSGVPPLINSADADTNWLLSTHPDAYLFGALAEAELFIGRDDRAPLWLQRREAAFLSIEQADRKARWGGHLQIQVDAITIPTGGASGGGIAAGGTNVIVSDIAPTGQRGLLWWDSSTSPGGGQLYLWYIDPSGSGQWVAATNQPGTDISAGIITVVPDEVAVTRGAAPRTVAEPVIIQKATPSIYVAGGPWDELTVRLFSEPVVGDTAQICVALPVAALTITDNVGLPVTGAPTTAYGPGAAIIMRFTDPGIWRYWK